MKGHGLLKSNKDQRNNYLVNKLPTQSKKSDKGLTFNICSNYKLVWTGYFFLP